MAKHNRVISFTPIMALATLLAVSLQLNGLLMMWKIHQAEQNDAIRAALFRKRNYSWRRLKRIKQRCLTEAFERVGISLVELTRGGKTFGQELHLKNVGKKTSECQEPLLWTSLQSWDHIFHQTLRHRPLNACAVAKNSSRSPEWSVHMAKFSSLLTEIPVGKPRSR